MNSDTRSAICKRPIKKADRWSLIVFAGLTFRRTTKPAVRSDASRPFLMRSARQDRTP